MDQATETETATPSQEATTMQTTYAIRRARWGGAVVEYGALSATYTPGGEYEEGWRPAHDADAVQAVVRRVIETGIEETLVIGTPPPPAPVEAEPYMRPCPRCGTYCYGDCR